MRSLKPGDLNKGNSCSYIQKILLNIIQMMWVVWKLVTMTIIGSLRCKKYKLRGVWICQMKYLKVQF